MRETINIRVGFRDPYYECQIAVKEIDGHHFAYVENLPGVTGDGETVDAARHNAFVNFASAVTRYQMLGMTPPFTKEQKAQQ